MPWCCSCCSFFCKHDYKITVETEDKPLHGNKACLNLELFAGNERITGKQLDASFSGEFQHGLLNTYTIENPSTEYPDIDGIKLSKATDAVDTDWYIGIIRVEKKTGNWNRVFSVLRLIKAGQSHHIHEYDTHLPNDTLYQEHPALLGDKGEYEYKFEKGLPVTLKALPEEETFSFSYGFKIVADIIWKRLSEPVNDSEELSEFDFDYLFKPFGEPDEIDRWKEDEKFGLQRLLGVNSSVIRRVKDIKQLKNLHVDEHEPLPNGLTLNVAMEARKLFIVDHAILNCPKNPEIILCSPIALFFLKEDKLMPVAIQLFQGRRDNNPVFFPTDDKYTWILAKMWFNNADAQIHQAISHLGYTHLIMEGFAIAAHRHLSKLHPIFKLLAPHFLHLMAINDLGMKELLGSGEYIDKLMSMGSEGAKYLIAKHKNTWRLNVEGCLEADIVDRGVEHNDLPFYPVRDDALLTYKAIEKYVDSYVRLYYRSDTVLQDDPEIQAWRYDMDRSASDGGLGVKGIPGEHGKFQKREELALVLTCIIYTCSVGHAAVNFKQYDEYAFPLNYPMMLIGQPPTDKRKRKLKEDVIPTIQPKIKLLTLMGLTKALSTRATKRLGKFEVNYIHDPAAVKLVKKFQKNLDNIRKEIEKRNKTRSAERAYPFLNPAEIPNAISI